MLTSYQDLNWEEEDEIWVEKSEQNQVGKARTSCLEAVGERRHKQTLEVVKAQKLVKSEGRKKK